MATVDLRNANARSYVSARLNDAKSFSPSSSFFANHAKADKILTNLIPIKANGFRGVVLTVIVGMYLDAKFNPTANFYDCNPRSIFEKGIFYALTEHRIPCGKSDPLNVAKNAQQLDIAWAKGRRPEGAAMAVVEFIKLLWENKGTTKFDELIKLFFLRLYQYGQFVESQNVAINYSDSIFYGASTANKLSKFVIECAEGGALTQFVVGLLISKFRQGNNNFASVDGYDESVFGTNTTSKKPADVWEVMADGELGKLYEITVKVIDEKRLDDCVDALRQLDILDKEVIFICDIPSNISTLNVVNGVLLHNGVAFQFVDIESFIKSIFVTLSVDEQAGYLSELQDFVFSVSRAVATKQYWATNFVNQ
jgi:hypothetical protein